jgi:tetratricopeptide (TPR) repeat protein
MGKREFATAVNCCDEAIRLDPDFAEAYNQRAIAHYLQEEFQFSIADCWRAAERMPCHFGAWAGMGHCYAHLGQREEALESYQRALEINPHLDCVRQAVAELRRNGHRPA